MSLQETKYRKLNFDKIKFSSDIVQMDDKLKSIPSMSLPQGITFAKAEKDFEQKCVKLATSY